MQKRAAKVGLDRPSHIVIGELESAIFATQSPARNSQHNELEEADQTPSRYRRTKAEARVSSESPFAWRSRGQLMSGDGEIQNPIRGRVKGRPVVDEGDHDGGDSQSENSEEDDDGSDIVVTGNHVHSLDPTPVSSGYEDEIVYE